MKPKVYVHPAVAEVERLHTSILRASSSPLTVEEQLKLLAVNLFNAHRNGDESAAIEINNWHPAWTGKAREIIMAGLFSETDAMLTIARAYGYSDWPAVEATGSRFYPSFERAVDLMLCGDTAGLENLLEVEPDLVRRRSAYGHGATLLHYAGSNGVELWRQLVPLNLPDLVRLLIRRGADPGAKARFYNEDYTAYELAATSSHPRGAGIREQLLQALQGN